jgi:hypothetical protein
MFSVSLFYSFNCCFFVVPNDEDDTEDGDTVFMPIKSNDDDEQVGWNDKIMNCYFVFDRLMIIMINFYHHRNMVIIHFGQNHVILVVKVQ